ncbi:hypothetical protein [Xanthobacter autotrophicus]|uniref:hypothetical protein n=1 Tax=Xanthobacter autotrophicus TaxID=280 RepID=UPI00372AC33B
MIRLNLSRGPKVLDLGHGVTVTVLPLTSGLMMEARRRLAARPVAAVAVDLIKEVGRLAVTSWSGVAGEDGAPAPVTDATVDALFDLYQFAEAFERLYIGPALTLAEEKNAFAPSPSGTSAGAPDIAEPAPSRAPTALMN